MVTYSGLTPVNADSLGTTFAQKGLLVKRNGANIEVTTDKADIPVAVTIDESSRDAAGNLEAAADATVTVVPLSGVQYLTIHTAGLLTMGESIYVHTAGAAAENGRVSTTSAGAKFVGYYMGESYTSVEGDLIPVLCRSA
jgi:hypothetical protein|tara:strand:- start:3449 stop:3868 length:420 start_codon:yes stop_codon:yes gene_type:complete